MFDSREAEGSVALMVTRLSAIRAARVESGGHSVAMQAESGLRRAQRFQTEHVSSAWNGGIQQQEGILVENVDGRTDIT